MRALANAPDSTLSRKCLSCQGDTPMSIAREEAATDRAMSKDRSGSRALTPTSWTATATAWGASDGSVAQRERMWPNPASPSARWRSAQLPAVRFATPPR
jgi:hypothetical protein